MKLTQLLVLVLTMVTLSNTAFAAGDTVCFSDFRLSDKNGQDYLAYVRATDWRAAYNKMASLSAKIDRRGKEDVFCIKRQDLVSYDTAQDGFVSYDDKRLALALKRNTLMICEIPNNDHPEDIVIAKHCKIRAL